jgi:hypothetical protein
MKLSDQKLKKMMHPIRKSAFAAIFAPFVAKQTQDLPAYNHK